ncbi:MAG TPA: aldo/keto reductase [Tepidisphaeraceae bacterium]
MNFRTIGRTQIKVSPIAMGCMSLCSNATYDDIPVDQAVATVHAAIDAGINFFDNAPMYGDGEAERRLGVALEGRRDKVVIADKIGSPNLSAQEVKDECEKSLKLLRTDYIDLYQIHWPRRKVPLDETLTAMEKLVSGGKVRALGVCNFGPLDLGEALAKHRLETNQVAYNLLFRAVEHEVRDICVDRHIGLLCYSPMAQGLLTGRFKSADEVPELRQRTRHFAKTRPQARHGENGCEAETFHAIQKLKHICTRIGHEMSDVAMAWLLHQPGVLGVLAGASKPEQIKKNVAAASIKLSPETLDELDIATRPVKQMLGANLDPWQSVSRIM